MRKKNSGGLSVVELVLWARRLKADSAHPGAARSVGGGTRAGDHDAALREWRARRRRAAAPEACAPAPACWRRARMNIPTGAGVGAVAATVRVGHDLERITREL